MMTHEIAINAMLALKQLTSDSTSATRVGILDANAMSRNTRTTRSASTPDLTWPRRSPHEITTSMKSEMSHPLEKKLPGNHDVSYSFALLL